MIMHNFNKQPYQKEVYDLRRNHKNLNARNYVAYIEVVGTSRGSISFTSKKFYGSSSNLVITKVHEPIPEIPGRFEHSND